MQERERESYIAERETLQRDESSLLEHPSFEIYS